MFKRFWSRVTSIVAPLQSIAVSLEKIAEEKKIYRELYEQELAYHSPPIYRITQAPSKDDTEVTYGTEPEDKNKNRLKGLMGGLPSDQDDD